MNKHFSIINKRGAITGSILVFLSIVLFAVFFAPVLSGGSKLWLIGVLFALICFFFSMMILISVINAGIDIKNGIVIFPDLDPAKGKQPQFHINDLKDIELRDGEGKTVDPYTDNLVGARFAFILKDDTVKIYYPIAVTTAQFEKVKCGMTEN